MEDRRRLDETRVSPDMPDDDATDPGDATTRPPVRRAEPEQLPPGSKVGRFTVSRVLGTGGMSIVYEATDEELKRRVALKVVKPGTVEPGNRERERALPLHEAQTIASLNHPNVVTVYEVGEIEDELFLAMEFVDGVTLGRWLAGERSRKEILDVFIQAGEGLAAAHAAGVVHRDFKPDNALIGADGRLRVLDFGLATIKGDKPSLDVAPVQPAEQTLAEGLKTFIGLSGGGTPLYMSPEQHLEEDVDARSDQFSFCIALYEVLYDRRPFEAATYSGFVSRVITGKVHERPPDSEVPMWLDRLVRKGLSPKREDRYASMEALLDEMTTAMEFEEVRRGRARAEVEGARAAMLRGDNLEARAKLRQALEVEDSSLARALWSKLSADPLIWKKACGQEATAVDVSPDGKTIAAGGLDGNLYLVDPVDRSTRVIRYRAEPIVRVAYAPDGTVYTADEVGHLARLRPGRSTPTPVGDRDNMTRGLSVSPDGAWLVSGGATGVIHLWKIGNEVEAVEVRQFAGHTGAILDCRFTPSGEQLVSAGADGTVRIWDFESGAVETKLEGHAVNVPASALAVSPDGKRLAFPCADDNAIRVLERDLGGWKLRTRLMGHTGVVSGVRFINGAACLISASHDGTLRVWPLETDIAPRVFPTKTQASDLQVLPDGRHVVSTGANLSLWDATITPAESQTRGHRGDVNAVVFNRDGTRIASAGTGGFVKIWDVELGEEIRSWPSDSSTITSAALSPDDQTLATCGYDSSVRLWNARSGKETGRLLGHTGGISAVAFLNNEVVTCGWDGSIRWWDLRQGVQIGVAPGAQPGFAVDAHASGSIAQGGASFVRVAGSNREIEWHIELENTLVLGVAWSGDGTRLAWSTENELCVRTLPAGTTQSRPLPGRAQRVAFSRDGRRVAGACRDGVVRLWDLEGDEIVELHGHSAAVFHVAFSPDDRRIASGSDDGTLRLWDVRAERAIWRGIALLPNLDALTHRGWQRPDGGTPGAGGTQWASRLSQALCGDTSASHAWLAMEDGGVEAWSLEQDRCVGRWDFGRVRRLESTTSGCYVETAEGITRVSIRGPDWRQGASNVWTVHGDGLWAAEDNEIVVRGPDGTEIQRIRRPAGLTAVAPVHGRVVAGFREGAIQFLSRSSESHSDPAFEDVSASPVIRIAEGPLDTVVTCHSDGSVGLLSLSDGTLLQQLKVHGAAIRVAQTGGKLAVLSDLGGVGVMDLSVFNLPYAELVRRVWLRVPVVWEGGRVSPQHPPESHPFRES